MKSVLRTVAGITDVERGVQNSPGRSMIEKEESFNAAATTRVERAYTKKRSKYSSH